MKKAQLVEAVLKSGEFAVRLYDGKTLCSKADICPPDGTGAVYVRYLAKRFAGIEPTPRALDLASDNRPSQRIAGIVLEDDIMSTDRTLCIGEAGVALVERLGIAVYGSKPMMLPNNQVLGGYYDSDNRFTGFLAIDGNGQVIFGREADACDASGKIQLYPNTYTRNVLERFSSVEAAKEELAARGWSTNP